MHATITKTDPTATYEEALVLDDLEEIEEDKNTITILAIGTNPIRLETETAEEIAMKVSKEAERIGASAIAPIPPLKEKKHKKEAKLTNVHLEDIPTTINIELTDNDMEEDGIHINQTGAKKLCQAALTKIGRKPTYAEMASHKPQQTGNKEPETPNPNPRTTTTSIPHKTVGFVVGKEGKVINSIQKRHEVKINISEPDTQNTCKVTITGKFTENAAKEIQEGARRAQVNRGETPKRTVSITEPGPINEPGSPPRKRTKKETPCRFGTMCWNGEDCEFLHQ